jgi:hypothetical protein
VVEKDAKVGEVGVGALEAREVAVMGGGDEGEVVRESGAG